MVQAKYKVRLERLAAEREALAASRVTFQVLLISRATPWSTLLRQLIVEGLAFRRMHRPKSSGPMKPARPKRVPFPIDI